ncbi:MAG TPA: diaminopimelate decarboxylase [Paraburkholderia sp.]
MPAAELARIYGTPLLVIDFGVVDEAIAGFLDACVPHGVEIAYAAKAFVCTGFARHLLATPLGLDVCSLGELATAERAGFPSQRLTLHGAGKNDGELQAAADGRVGRIVADSLEELQRYAALARDGSAAVLLRCNTGIEAHTHAFVRTGGDATKFGVHPRDEERAATILRECRTLRFLGLHAHIGSQIHDSAAFAENAAALTRAAARFVDYGSPVAQLVAGGGFGVVSGAGSAREDRRSAIDAMVRRIAEGSAELGIPTPQLGIEPGRSIVAAAGTTIYRVMAVKRQTTRTFVIVDGGLTENPRPALYGAAHPVAAVERGDRPEREVTLCGRSCENDELGTAFLPEDLRAGEFLAMQMTGAYTYSMASNYNRFPKPAVVALKDGHHELLIRRETVDDVLRNDVV